MRCALICGNLVVNVVEADPEKDVFPGHTLIATAEANIGWIYDGQKLYSSDVTITTLPEITNNVPVI